MFELTETEPETTMPLWEQILREQVRRREADCQRLLRQNVQFRLELDEWRRSGRAVIELVKKVNGQ